MAESLNSKALEQLSMEMVYHRFLMGRREVRRFMDGLGTVEFIILSMALTCERKYLKDIAKDLEMPMNEVAHAVERLKDKGLVIWTHDGYGVDGTYIMVNETGREVAEEHKKKMIAYYEKILDEVTDEEIMTFMTVLRKLTNLLK